MTEPCLLSAIEARRLIGAKKLSPVELLESCLKRIAKTNKAINAVVAMDEKRARMVAREQEAQVMRGDDLGLLHGLPIGIKDLEPTAGLRTTWGSPLYKDHIPDVDHPMVANIRASGGIIFAKTNVPEFGAGANTKNLVYGATGNPFNTDLTAAGSSGGSAAALAADMMPLATGSDYAGSLRTPAAFCGVTGYRPSPGIVPSTERSAGIIPWAVLGPMGRTVTDAHLLLKAQCDTDRDDPYSSLDHLQIPETLAGIDLAPIRLALSADFATCPIDKKIRGLFKRRAKSFISAFAVVEEATPDFSGVHDIFDVHRGLAMLAGHRDRYRLSRNKLGANIIDDVERGLKYSSDDIARAMVEQHALYRRFNAFFDAYDILIAPAAAVSPFPHAQRYASEINGQTLDSYARWMALAYAPTMALCCACAIPCGVDHLGMPFGIQIIGPKGADALVLEVAQALELVLASNEETRRPVPTL